MKEIKLTQGKFAQVDDEDFDFLNQWNWYAHLDGYSWYALRTVYNPKKQIALHRLIMNTPIDMEVDHIDHNGLNCQKYNMRNCKHVENIKNKKASGRSRYLGVSYNGSKIRATIKINNKYVYLGCFKTEEEAAVAYDNVAKIYHKEFANLNFPNNG